MGALSDSFRTFSKGNFLFGFGTAFAVSVLGHTLANATKPLVLDKDKKMRYLSNKDLDALDSSPEDMVMYESMQQQLKEMKEQNLRTSQDISLLYHELVEVKRQLEELKPD